MGFLEGFVTSAKPPAGVAPADEPAVRERLLAIAGPDMSAYEEDGRVVVAWSAEVERAGGEERLFRAIEVELDAAAREARGICIKNTKERRGLGLEAEWSYGQYVGSEWSRGRGGGYSFNWSELRRPVIEAVTGAGWTYRPRWLFKPKWLRRRTE